MTEGQEADLFHRSKSARPAKRHLLSRYASATKEGGCCTIETLPPSIRSETSDVGRNKSLGNHLRRVTRCCVFSPLGSVKTKLNPYPARTNALNGSSRWRRVCSATDRARPLGSPSQIGSSTEIHRWRLRGRALTDARRSAERSTRSRPTQPTSSVVVRV